MPPVIIQMSDSPKVTDWLTAAGTILAACFAVYIAWSGRKHDDSERESDRQEARDAVARSAARDLADRLSDLLNTGMKKPIDPVVRRALERGEATQLPFINNDQVQRHCQRLMLCTSEYEGMNFGVPEDGKIRGDILNHLLYVRKVLVAFAAGAALPPDYVLPDRPLIASRLKDPPWKEGKVPLWSPEIQQISDINPEGLDWRVQP